MRFTFVFFAIIAILALSSTVSAATRRQRVLLNSSNPISDQIQCPAGRQSCPCWECENENIKSCVYKCPLNL